MIVLIDRQSLTPPVIGGGVHACLKALHCMSLAFLQRKSRYPLRKGKKRMEREIATASNIPDSWPKKWHQVGGGKPRCGVAREFPNLWQNERLRRSAAALGHLKKDPALQVEYWNLESAAKHATRHLLTVFLRLHEVVHRWEEGCRAGSAADSAWSGRGAA